MWPIALVHGLAAGRAAPTWVIVSYVVCVLLVLVGLAVRLSVSLNRRKDFASTSTGAIKPVGSLVPTQTPAPKKRPGRREPSRPGTRRRPEPWVPAAGAARPRPRRSAGQRRPISDAPMSRPVSPARGARARPAPPRRRRRPTVGTRRRPRRAAAGTPSEDQRRRPAGRARSTEPARRRPRTGDAPPRPRWPVAAAPGRDEVRRGAARAAGPRRCRGATTPRRPRRRRRGAAPRPPRTPRRTTTPPARPPVRRGRDAARPAARRRGTTRCRASAGTASRTSARHRRLPHLGGRGATDAAAGRPATPGTTRLRPGPGATGAPTSTAPTRAGTAAASSWTWPRRSVARSRPELHGTGRDADAGRHGVPPGPPAGAAGHQPVPRAGGPVAVAAGDAHDDGLDDRSTGVSSGEAAVSSAAGGRALRGTKVRSAGHQHRHSADHRGLRRVRPPRPGRSPGGARRLRGRCRPVS